MEVQGRTVINNMQIQTSEGTVYWQEDEPTNPQNGDTWFKVINGKATNAYNRENGAWVKVEFSSQVIAEELVGKIITAAEINGGEINGTKITSAEFLNEYENVNSGLNQVTDGKLAIKDGILQAGSTYYLTNAAGEKLYKFASAEADIHQGALNLKQKLYDETGKKTSESTTAVSGGLITLGLSDVTGNFNGMLDAKLLESIGTVKSKTVNIPNNSNFQNASIVYYRWGQFVIARFYFDLLKSDGYIGLAAHETGYRPISLPMASGILPSTAGPSRYCVIYSNNAGWRLIPSKYPTETLGTIQGSIMYLTNDTWQDA